MATIPIKKNEATAARRRVYFNLVDVTDGMTPEIAEGGQQPEISVDGAQWTTTGIGVLVDIHDTGGSTHTGSYYADLTQTVVNADDAVIKTRYKSTNTAQAYGDTAIVSTVWVDTMLDRNLGTGVDSGGRTVRNALRPNVNKVAISGATLTVYKENDSTEAWSATIATSASADPITSIDPA
jgi:hypothetical protein